MKERDGFMSKSDRLLKSNDRRERGTKGDGDTHLQKPKR